jgi:hypothetical protein
VRILSVDIPKLDGFPAAKFDILKSKWLPTAASPVAAASPARRMEIVLIGGERIVVGADVDASSLARVVKALSRR